MIKVTPKKEMTDEELFDKCREKWGLPSQIIMLAEECGELVEATLHLLRNKKQENALKHFEEEIADVELMIDEMKHYFKNASMIAKWRKAKIARLKKRLEE